MTISSRQNVWFKRIREAIHDHDDEIVIEGPKAVADAVAAGWVPIKTFGRSVDFTVGLFYSLPETKSPQNGIGLFHPPQPSLHPLLPPPPPLLLPLDAGS